MTKEQCREVGTVMIAWADGKTIQWRHKVDDEWHDIGPDWDRMKLCLDLDDFEYRIKP